ncbi:hypothetical protein [Pokkaliibacter plantistimulans]|uniref:hypothetical protein n=1 Tax=Pokkaliibacter plantistimulans TaxID=1635171 RepID=UPI002D77A290|nr:hypothetical protein [Pokkaliibacter plantistimulans]
MAPKAAAPAPRLIAVDDHLEFAQQVLSAGSRNLIASHENYLDFLQQVIHPARDILHVHYLKGFHELRVAYVCERYEQIT